MNSENEALQQAEALARIRSEILEMSQSELARALERHRSQVSRWENPSEPRLMSAESRLRLARLVASRFRTLEAVEGQLREIDWNLTESEWKEVELHLKRTNLYRYMPPMC